MQPLEPSVFLYRGFTVGAFGHFALHERAEDVTMAKDTQVGKKTPSFSRMSTIPGFSWKRHPCVLPFS